MARQIGPEAIEKGTGRSFETWISIFGALESQPPTHQELVAAAIAAGSRPWWCQMVSVAYERHISLKVLGQDVTGEFSVAVTSTRDADIDTLYARWIALVDTRTSFADVEIATGPDRSVSDKWRYWRCGLTDESKVVVNVGEKQPSKSVISVQHEKLASKMVAESIALQGPRPRRRTVTQLSSPTRPGSSTSAADISCTGRTAAIRTELLKLCSMAGQERGRVLCALTMRRGTDRFAYEPSTDKVMS